MASLVKRYGPWAVVVGAADSLGAAFAEVLVEHGFSLVLIARRIERLNGLATELQARYGRPIEVLALDLAATDLQQRLEAIAHDREMGLVVYNATSSIVAPFLDTALADKQRILDVNTRGPVIAAHVFGKLLAARGGGGIVLLSSLTASWNSPWVATYSATRAFSLSFGDALAHEFSEHGVDVVARCAGATRTPAFVQLASGREAPRTMTPEAAARETLAALSSRGRFVPRALNRVARRVLSRLLPRRIAVRIMAGNTKSLM
jgi:uncharacterized protein